MHCSTFFLFISVALLPSFINPATPKIPPYMKFCKRDANYHECLLAAASEAIHVMSDKGEPSFGILPLDPFRFNTFEMNQGSGPVSINLTFTDLDFIAMKTVQLENAQASWNPLELKIGLANKRASFIGDYKINGKVLVLPIVGSGRGNITLTGFKVDMVISGKEYTKNGKIYVNINKCNFIVKEVERVYMNFENLFNGDKALSDQMNKFMNENWKVLLDELKEPLLNGLCQGVEQVANKIFTKIPFDIITPNFNLDS